LSKKRCGIQTFFSTTTYAPIPVFSGCQKNVAVFKRFFLQPLMPLFRISVHYDGKRYLVVVKKALRYSNVFFYNHLCPYSVFRYIMMESGIIRQKANILQ